MKTSKLVTTSIFYKTVHGGVLCVFVFTLAFTSNLPVVQFIYCDEIVSALSCPTLGKPMNCSPPGSTVHGIFQAKILEWVAISFSKDEIYYS